MQLNMSMFIYNAMILRFVLYDYRKSPFLGVNLVAIKGNYLVNTVQKTLRL
jgi:hypothetical protein